MIIDRDLFLNHYLEDNKIVESNCNIYCEKYVKKVFGKMPGEIKIDLAYNAHEALQGAESRSDSDESQFPDYIVRVHLADETIEKLVEGIGKIVEKES